jgi:hypothetical protein
MKILIWSIFSLIVSALTGVVAVAVQVTEWVVSTVATGQIGELATSVEALPVPAWLAVWFDPAAVEAMRAVLVEAIGWLSVSLPGLAGTVDWLAPLMWVGWGLVVLLILTATVFLHGLVGRVKTSPALPRAFA